MVDELRDDDSKWNKDIIEEIFDDQATQSILKVKCANDQRVDKLCWKHTSSGECTSKSAYNYLFKENNSDHSIIPTLHLNLLKKMWSDRLIPPKVKTFMWRLLRNALPTANNLHFRISVIPDSSHKCNLPETAVHMFFHCSFARLSWRVSEFNLNFQVIDNMSSVPEILSFILATSPLTESVQKICILLWFIWKARNDSYFKKKNWEPSQVCIAAEVVAANYSILAPTQNQDQNLILLNTPDSNIFIPPGKDVLMMLPGKKTNQDLVYSFMIQALIKLYLSKQVPAPMF